MPKTQTAPRPITIPAGTRSALCNGTRCGATIYFVFNPRTGRTMPISCDCEGGQTPSETKADPAQQSLFGEATPHHDGLGISHFLNCVNAGDFTRGAKR